MAQVTQMSERSLFKYCRMCGAHWVNLGPVSFEWHKPGCRLLMPGRGGVLTEAPRKVSQ